MEYSHCQRSYTLLIGTPHLIMQSLVDTVNVYFHSFNYICNIYLTKVSVNLSIVFDKPTKTFTYQELDVNTNQKNLMLATLRLAIDEAGGISALAKLMPDTPSRQAVDNWTKNGVPAKRAVHIEVALKGRVRRQELRPDLFA